MALLTAGWFTTRWFPSRWWQTDNQWWTEYGTAVTPTAAVQTGGFRHPRRRRLDRETLQLLRDYLQLKLS